MTRKRYNLRDLAYKTGVLGGCGEELPVPVGFWNDDGASQEE